MDGTAEIGRRVWALAGGRVPLRSTGPEPEHTSREELCVLNAGDRDAQVEIRFYYGDRDPVGPYRLCVEASRVRQVRVNDLIDPQAVPLDTPYGCVVRADVPVVVQFSRQDTSQPANALLGLVAYPADG
jgi:hypothetical protein